jgi:serine/threonine protein kinase
MQLPKSLPETLPASFGRYRLDKLLGRGGMGSVYLAHDSQLDRPVALKIPLFDSNDGSHVLERFYREARAAATVHHPNICPIYDVGEWEGLPYLTMAYIEGKALAEMIQAGKRWTPRQCATWVRKVALALADAHKHGVIHRDLKPANIMIDTRGEPVVMDFGLARRARAGDPRLTQKGVAFGTPAYMPPEQVSGDIEIMGPGTDVYSLGVILYELLSGRPPFTGDLMAVLSKVLLDEPPPLSQLRPDVPPKLEAICQKAMAKKVQDRYSSMTALAAVLADFLRGSNAAVEVRAAPTLPPASAKTLPAAPSKPMQEAATLPPAAKAEPQPSTKLHPKRRKTGKKGPLWPWLVGAGGVALGVLSLAALLLYMVFGHAGDSDPARAQLTSASTGPTKQTAKKTLNAPAKPGPKNPAADQGKPVPKDPPPANLRLANGKSKAILGATGTDLQDWVNSLGNYVPVSVSCHGLGPTPLFSAIANDVGKPMSPVAHYNLSGKEFDQDILLKGSNSDYRLRSFAGYQSGPDVRYVALWAKNDLSEVWRVVPYKPSAEFREALTVKKLEGFCPVHISGHMVGKTHRVGATCLAFGGSWLPPEIDLTIEECQKKLEKYKPEKHFPQCVSAYPTENGTRFAVVLIPRPDSIWPDPRLNCTAAEYQAEFHRWTARGYMAHSLCGYLWQGEIRYACVFVKLT